jgi:molecular chaperone DnaK
MARVVGIDLGTTNTCVAYVSNKIPRVIPTESGFNTLPSVVTFAADGSVKVGQAAKDYATSEPERTVYGIKRLLGRQYNSRVVQELKRYFTYAIVQGENGEAAASIGGKIYSTAMVQSQILTQIKRYAEINLGDDIPDVVIAVPAYYSDHQRMLVKDAGKLAGWNVRRIVNEPTAAALAYGFNRGFDQKILIYDLGGGTFDVSILEITGNVFQVIATGGDMFLGGADFDSRIQDWLLEQFKKKTKIDLNEEPAAVQKVRGAAERAKIELSLLAHTEIRISNVIERRGKGIDFEQAMDRETLNRLTKDLVDRTIAVVDKLLAETGIAKSEIDEVIPVGGQTRMPLVVDTLTNHYGKPPRKGIHPDECVALGAALLGDSLSTIDAVTLLDTLSRPIGIADEQGLLRVVIDKNIRLPHKSVVEMHTKVENQAAFELEIFQAEAKTPVKDSEYLGTLTYGDIPAAPAGQIKISIEFTLDSEGMLSLTAKNDRSDNPQSVRLATIGRPKTETEPVLERQGPRVAEPEPPEDSAGLKGFVRSFLKK